MPRTLWSLLLIFLILASGCSRATSAATDADRAAPVAVAVEQPISQPGGDPANQNRSAPSGDQDAQPLASAAPTASPTPVPSPTPTPVRAPVLSGAAPLPQLSARAVVVIDEATGAVLFERNSHERLAPASVTKIATAIVALEHGDPKDRVTVYYDATGLEDSTLMGVNPGDRVTLEDLLYGIMLPSGNEAALAIADHVAGSEEDFVAMMNDLVRKVGLRDTHFLNPHGLDAYGHYTSAYDITMLARYGMTHYPLFARVAAARSYDVHGRTADGRPKDWVIYNMNRAVREYPGADGVKIGYTDAAGRTIVASVTRNGHRVYVGLLGSGDLWSDSYRLFDWVFANYAWR